MKSWLVLFLLIAFSASSYGLKLTPAHELPVSKRRLFAFPKPSRLEGPLREDNITDEEVREIQGVVAGILPGALVSISGVSAQCTCEEAATCTNQVAIIAYTPSTSSNYVLSRIDEKWAVGRLQEWWLLYDAHSAMCSVSHSEPEDAARARAVACDKENHALWDSPPVCAVAQQAVPGDAPASRARP